MNVKEKEQRGLSRENKEERTQERREQRGILREKYKKNAEKIERFWDVKNTKEKGQELGNTQ